MAPENNTAETSTVTIIPALLTMALVRKHFVPIAERTLHRWVSSGQFPRPEIAIGGKVRYWKRETVENWIDARAQETDR